MRRIFALFSLLILFSAVVPISKIGVVKSEPSIIIVPDDFSTIQEALDAASEGDTVFVKRGTYYENLDVTKSLSLVGEDKETTIIDGDKTGPIVLIKNDRVVIANLTVQNGGPITNDSSYFDAHTGIHLLQVQHCNVSNNVLINNGYGIWLYGSSENNIVGNYIKTGNSGIRLDVSSKQNNVIGNRIENITLKGQFGHMAFGLHLSSGSSENIVKGNNFTQNEYGIFGYGCFNNSFIENNIIDNTYGIDFCGSSRNNTIYHNNFINSIQVGKFPQSEYSNFWDNGIEGNYWSDYTGTDSDGNGIGDSPYFVYENNEDNYPLMEPYIIPEFPSWIILPLFLVATLFIIIVRKKIRGL